MIEQWQETFPAMIHTLPDGALIVPHVCAGGMYDYYRQCDVPRAKEAGAIYLEAVSELFAMLHAQLSRAEMHSLCQRASLRNVPVVPGETRPN